MKSYFAIKRNRLYATKMILKSIFITKRSNNRIYSL